MRVLTTAYQHLVGEGRNVAIAMAGLPHAVSSVLNDEFIVPYLAEHLRGDL